MPRVAYNESTEDLNKILKLFGFPKSAHVAVWHDAEVAIEIRDNLKKIYDRHQHEEKNDYRRVIVELLSWIGSGYNVAFVERVSGVDLNVMFVMRKGLEAVHVLLARDLRRKNLTLNEKQMIGDFKDLTAKLEDPRTFQAPIKSPA